MTDNVFSREANEHFENEVRRIARLLWPEAQFSGAAEVDGRERDGIFITEECIHCLEATTSRKKEKAQEDIGKMAALAPKLQRNYPCKAIRCWFITQDEPTVEQRKIADQHRPLVNALSFSQFQAKLIDSKAYLSARIKYYFGSVRDPSTGDKNPTVEFIEAILSRIDSDAVISSRDLLALTKENNRLVILGDYGAGKSMVLRYLFKELSAAHNRGETPRFPVFINLRDHYGQQEPAELLERHARNVGFANPLHLVRAWRAGYVHLLLDGFDEITTLNIQGLWTKLHENRFRAMEAVRRLIREHPIEAGLVVAGRAHFFNNSQERHKALGLSGRFAEFSLNEFNDEQLTKYMTMSGINGTIAPWLPSRPLLVAYLAARDLLPDPLSNNAFEPAAGWDDLLRRIASREAEIEAGIDGETVRRILERLATKARALTTGLGPLPPEFLTSAFSEVCGYAPDERGMVLLQRLPGLGVDRDEESTRIFIDEDFVDACRAGDIFHFANMPFHFDLSVLSSIDCATGNLGIAIAGIRAALCNISSGKLNAAIRFAQDKAPAIFTVDLYRVAIDCGFDIEFPLRIRGVVIPEIEFTARTGNSSQVEFQDCFFNKIGLDSDVAESTLPRFKGCYVGEIDGRVSLLDLPRSAFGPDCIVDSFSATMSTTASVLSLDLPLGTRVVITILKKLYHRRGSGRRENALFRGLDHHARRLVPEALRLIQREGLADFFKRGDDIVWIPDRTKMHRVGRIISAPTSVDDPLIREAGLL